MMDLCVSVDLARIGSSLSSLAICEQVQYSPHFPKGAAPELVVSIDGTPYMVIDPPSGAHVMSELQRDAMERAFWRSVEVVDNGYEE